MAYKLAGIEERLRTDKAFFDRVVAESPDVASFEDDEDAIPNAILAHGKKAWRTEWDGGGMPGTAGAMSIVEWHGYFFFISSDHDPEGPFASLEEAKSVLL